LNFRPQYQLGNSLPFKRVVIHSATLRDLYIPTNDITGHLLIYSQPELKILPHTLPRVDQEPCTSYSLYKPALSEVSNIPLLATTAPVSKKAITSDTIGGVQVIRSINTYPANPCTHLTLAYHPGGLQRSCIRWICQQYEGGTKTHQNLTIIIIIPVAKLTTSMHWSNSGDTCSRNLYQKLAPMHMTKIMQFDWSAVFKSFW